MSIEIEMPIDMSKQILKREMKALALASGFIGEAIGTCPMDQLGWNRAWCDDDCGSAGRDGKDNFVRCWREYFIEMAEKKGKK